ncbi:SIR2 family NAD-dependent protein deacylase [Pseudotenacibaculum haliotis]|uniref:NAD-dependent protein deacylase n=1 Tax=Pseudotenacibaculum haliotis TaxID=1862138 RepID=A0ABW5LU14_9FLAO
MKKLVVLTGAGMSAESGIKTFRDADGLWEGHDVMEVATPEGFDRNPELVLEFYNQRRRQLKEVDPNQGHKNLTKLQEHFDVEIITQNVDDLHERAGSTKVLHLHGELRKVRSTINTSLIYEWEDDLVLGNTCEKGYQLRPHIVWFGEDVPMIERAAESVEKADILVIIGTSMQVYPAAGLINFCQPNTPIYFIDPRPNIEESYYRNLTVIEDTAVGGTEKLLMKLID